MRSGEPDWLGSAARRSLGSVTVVALLTACSTPSVGAAELPDRPPDLQGTVAGEPPAYLVETSPMEDGAWGDVSGDYFEGMSLGGSAQDDTIVVGSDNGALTRSDLAPGDVVEVWIGDGCGESLPVQCEVVAIRVAAQAN